MTDDRLIGEAIQCWAQGPNGQRLEALGWSRVTTTADTSEVHATGPSGLRVRLTQGLDVYAIAACLALGQYGALWPVVCPTLLARVARVAKLYQQALNERSVP